MENSNPRVEIIENIPAIDIKTAKCEKSVGVYSLEIIVDKANAIICIKTLAESNLATFFKNEFCINIFLIEFKF